MDNIDTFTVESSYGVVVHRNFVPLYADDKYANIYGFESSDDLLALSSLYDIIDPAFHAAAKKTYDAIMAGRMTPGVRSYVNQGQDGKAFTVLTVEHVIQWEGEPALQITVIDMSMLDQANERLRENEKKYRDLIFHSFQGILVSRDRRPLLVNKAFVEITRANSIAQVMACDDLAFMIDDERHEYAKNKYMKLINGELNEVSSVIRANCFDGTQKMLQLYENTIEWEGAPAIQTMVVDITEKYELEQKLEYQAKHDDLTGALKRNAVYDYLNKLPTDVASIACLMVDIDDFKSINDQYGHKVGDEVITRTAHLFQQLLSEKGIVGRWGGEEFIGFIPNCNHAEVVELAETLLTQIRAERFTTNGDDFSITVSIGAHASGMEARDWDQKIMIADMRLYQAKSSGKNRYVG